MKKIAPIVMAAMLISACSGDDASIGTPAPPTAPLAQQVCFHSLLPLIDDFVQFGDTTVIAARYPSYASRVYILLREVGEEALADATSHEDYYERAYEIGRLRCYDPSVQHLIGDWTDG